MNAAIAIPESGSTVSDRAADTHDDVVDSAPVTSTDSGSASGSASGHSRAGFGLRQLVSVGLTMLAVFGLTVASMTYYNGQVLAAVGLGIYLAIWLGLGFGFLIGGISWSLAQDDGGH